MKIFLFVVLSFISSITWANSSLDELRWYLHPQGQKLLLSIDDLHDETVTVNPLMDWGRGLVSETLLKKEVLIAVIDGGIDVEHPELQNWIYHNEADCFQGSTIPPMGDGDKDQNGYKGDCAGWNFVEDTNRAEDLDGHGTHVSGIIHSALQGVQGVVKLLPLKVFAPDEGRRNAKNLAPLSVRLVKAFEYALSHGVDVIHMSVGWPKSFMTHELTEVIQKALDQDVIIVSAAGNSSQIATIWPCQMKGIICVGALRPNGDFARFSNHGNQVDILAPGEQILSTIPFTVAPLHLSRKGYDYKNGTSQAAPFISAAMAILRGLYPDEPRDYLYARLMLGADSGNDGRALKGLFHLDREINLTPRSFIFPQMKGLHSVVVDSEGNFSFEIPIKNYWIDETQTIYGQMNCNGGELLSQSFELPALESQKEVTVTFKGRLFKHRDELECRMSLLDQDISFKLQVQYPLKAPLMSFSLQQEEHLVVNTRNGVRSRFMTMNPLKGQNPEPFYYLAYEKSLTVYHLNDNLGKIEFLKDCQFLRIWQGDLNRDGKSDFMLENLCEKSFLRYQFFHFDLSELYPSVTYKPSLTIVNYDDFQVLPQKVGPPVFQFLNVGLLPPSPSPWDSAVSTKARHLYELRPKFAEESWKFEVSVLEKPEVWKSSLKLRYLPAYAVLHFLGDKLLVKLGRKSMWVDIDSQEAQWAPALDEVLLEGSQKQNLLGTKNSILQSLLTAFEYRGYLLHGIKLRYSQKDVFNPLLDVVATIKNELGYLCVLRSFGHLIFVQYDETGALLSERKFEVDRFDFLTAQELISSVMNLSLDNSMIQVIDGTKINSNYVDVIKNEVKKSYKIPVGCVTQTPVVMQNNVAALPIFCAKNLKEFEMSFIEL